MPLSPEEQAELEALQSSPAPKAQASSGLTPDEAAELQSLQATTDPESKDSKDKTEKLIGNNATDALRGYTSGASLGSESVLGGAVQAGLDKAQQLGNKIAPNLINPSPSQVGAKLAAQGTIGDVGPTSTMDMYQQGKKETKKAFDTSKERSPVLYGASALAGAAVPMALAGATPGALAAQGAISNLNSSDADLIGPNANPVQATINAGIGAGIGFGAGKLTQGLSGLSAAGAKAGAVNQAARALNLAPEIKAGATATGQAILDSGLPVTGSNLAVNQAAQTAKQTAGSQIGKLFAQAQPGITDDVIAQVGPIDSKFETLTNDFLNNNQLKPSEVKLVDTAARDEVARLTAADGDLTALNTIKQDLQNAAKTTYGKGSPQQNTAVANYYNRLADLVKTHIEDLANGAQEGLGDQIQQTNAQYGALKNGVTATNAAAKAESIGSGAGPGMNPLKWAAKLAGIKDPTLLGQTASANILNSPTVQKAAEVTGKVAQTFSPVANAAATSPAAQGAAKSFYNQDNQKYKEYAQKLASNPATAHIGTALNNAIDSNNELSKTQALFVIQQNPQARKVIDQGNQ